MSKALAGTWVSNEFRNQILASIPKRHTWLSYFITPTTSSSRASGGKLLRNRPWLRYPALVCTLSPTFFLHSVSARIFPSMNSRCSVGQSARINIVCCRPCCSRRGQAALEPATNHGIVFEPGHLRPKPGRASLCDHSPEWPSKGDQFPRYPDRSGGLLV